MADWEAHANYYMWCSPPDRSNRADSLAIVTMSNGINSGGRFSKAAENEDYRSRLSVYIAKLGR